MATFWGSMLSSEEMVKGMKDPVFKKSLTWFMSQVNADIPSKMIEGWRPCTRLREVVHHVVGVFADPLGQPFILGCRRSIEAVRVGQGIASGLQRRPRRRQA